MGFLIVLAILAPVFLVVIPWWKIFSKAGQPGWACLIPIYNIIVWLQVIRKPIWWIILFIIPLVNVIIMIMMYDGLSRAFGKGAGTTLGLIFLPIIFFPILGYGSAEYQLPKKVGEIDIYEVKS